MSHSAEAVEPTVPSTVTASGCTPRRTSQAAVGSTTPLSAARAHWLITGGATPRPRPDPGSRRAAAGSPSSARSTVMKLASPPHRGTTCWCRWSASEPPATCPRLMPTLNPCGAATARSARTACWVTATSSAVSSSVELVESGDVPVRHDHEVAGVVRVQVEHRVDRARRGRGPGPSSSSRVGMRQSGHCPSTPRRCRPRPRCRPSGAGSRDAGTRRGSRRPELVEVLGSAVSGAASPPSGQRTSPRRARRSRGGATQSTIAATASSTGTPLSCEPSRNRNDTAPGSTSLPPASSMNGTFCSVWLRIFFCMRSSESSTSTRRPSARSAVGDAARRSRPARR